MDLSAYCYWAQEIYVRLFNLSKVIIDYTNKPTITYHPQRLKDEIIYIKKHLDYYLVSNLPFDPTIAVMIIRQAEDIYKKESEKKR